MNNLLKFACLLSLLLTALPSHAWDFEEDGLCYNILSEKSRAVGVTHKYGSSFNKDYVSGDLEIPSKVIHASKTWNITEISDSAFMYCSSLTSVAIPNSVRTISYGAFAECSSLASVTIPYSVTHIQFNVFMGCNKLSAINVDINNQNYRSIDGLLYFQSLSHLVSCPGTRTSVTIPYSVLYIGNWAFAGCSSLASVTIPYSVEGIANNAFSGCSSLASIYCQAITPPNCKWDIFDDEVLENAILYVPKSSKAKYETADTWRNFRNIKGMDFSGIDDTTINDSQLQISVVDGVLTIGSIGGNEAVAIYDMQGRMMYRGTERVISDLAPGIYVAKISNKTAKFTI